MKSPGMPGLFWFPESGLIAFDCVPLPTCEERDASGALQPEIRIPDFYRIRSLKYPGIGWATNPQPANHCAEFVDSTPGNSSQQGISSNESGHGPYPPEPTRQHLFLRRVATHATRKRQSAPTSRLALSMQAMARYLWPSLHPHPSSPPWLPSQAPRCDRQTTDDVKAIVGVRSIKNPRHGLAARVYLLPPRFS